MSGGIYVHVPFCKGKCIYCDFYSIGIIKADWSLYAQRVIEEYSERRHEIPENPLTLYFGGGTPSLIPTDVITTLVKALRRDSLEEVTIEVNPDDVTEEKCLAWKEGGINRVSMGVQSFSDPELKAICRRHDATTALNAYATLQRHFSNISIDLMFGLPGQTLESWEHTVDTAISLRPHHISSYSLMYEEGTPLTRMRDRGLLSECDEEESLQMFATLIRRLRDAGYDHYEISNFAKPGFRSRHNSSYWDHAPYLGLGPGAHSFDGKHTRRSNPADIKAYLAGNLRAETEELSLGELMEETVMTRLRTREGIDLDDFARHYGKSNLERLLGNSRRHIAEGNLVMSPSGLSLSEAAIFISDSIILDLVQ